MEGDMGRGGGGAEGGRRVGENPAVKQGSPERRCNLPRIM